MSTYDRIRKNNEKVNEALHEARLVRCTPVARDVMKLIASKADVVAIGEVEQTHKDYEDLAVEVMKLFLEKDIHWSDREFIFQLALQPMSFTQSVVTNSLNNSWNGVITGLFGKKSHDLTMADVDKALKRGDEIEGTPDIVV